MLGPEFIPSVCTNPQPKLNCCQFDFFRVTMMKILLRAGRWQEAATNKRLVYSEYGYY